MHITSRNGNINEMKENNHESKDNHRNSGHTCGSSFAVRAYAGGKWTVIKKGDIVTVR
jgi:hypothetical protein